MAAAKDRTIDLDHALALTKFAESGFLVIDHLIPLPFCEQLSTDAAIANFANAGSRHLLANPLCRQLALYLKTHRSIRALLPDNAVTVQCTLFDKSQNKNWLVSLHQDLSIPVQAQVESPLCRGWSKKDGHWFVQPPVDVLSQLVAVRIHIDASTADNGPLRVIAGTHRFGRLTLSNANAQKQVHAETTLLVPRGGAIAMRPLLLHASSKATSSCPRRVLHFLFGPDQLPYGLKWGVLV